VSTITTAGSISEPPVERFDPQRLELEDVVHELFGSESLSPLSEALTSMAISACI
jgi:hypothetical protein